MAKQLRTDLIIGGKTTSGFDGLAGKMGQLGAVVDQLGGKIREWESDAVEVYKDYETLMLEAEGAMTTQYKSASERARAMATLEEHVSDWAANSIFHTDDMARAVNEAAHAGWDLEEMLEGIPVAMNLAQAGNITLSEGLDDLIKTLNATGKGTDYAATMVDQWTLAANSSATNVAELGDALTAMGSTAVFADSTEELFTMLAVLADTGTVGSRAGTLLRNSMLRLIAPTKKAAEAMDGLEVTEEELEELAADSGQLEEANRLLEEQGFSAYDANGKLKPFLTTFKDLDKALEGMDEEDRNNVLASIFPTRTITGAMAMLKAAAEDYDGLLADISGSEGYAARIARIQTSGLMGSTEILKSKEEELKRKVGELLSGPIETFQEKAGGVLDWLNNLPEEKLAGLTGAATALGAMGPGLIAGSWAIKGIAALGPWGTAFVVAAIGATGLAAQLAKLNEINFKDNFGTMELDLEKLGSYVEGTAGKLTAEQEAVEKWSGSLADAQANYQGLTSALSEELMFDTLTGKQLTDQEKERLTQYGKGIGKSLLSGIGSARRRDMDFLDVLFGDMQTQDETDAATMSYDLVNSWYKNLTDRAEEVSEELRTTLASAMNDDGIISETERDNIINKTIQTMNEIQAAISDRMDRQAYFEELARAGNVSWDSAEEYLQSLNTGLTEKKKANEELYYREWGIIEAAIEDAVKNGTEFEWNGEKTTVTEANREAVTKRIRDEFQREFQENQARIDSEFGVFAEAALEALMNGSDEREAWQWLTARNAEGITDFSSLDWSKYSDAELESLSENLRMLNEVSGPIMKLLNPQGEVSGRYKALIGQSGLAGEAIDREIQERGTRRGQTVGGVDEYGQAVAENLDSLGSEDLDSLNDLTMSLDAEITRLTGLGQNADNLIQQWEAANNRLDELTGVTTHVRDEAPENLPEYYVDYLARTTGGTEAGEQALSEVEGAVGEGVEVPVGTTGGTEAMNAELAGMQSTANRGVTVPIFTRQGGPGVVKPALFATGGRATEASIFGEGDVAEWAIPEEHTERTADLLTAAAQASGFGWDELLARNGGLNGDAGNVVVNTTYAPTINAGDANGVEGVLEKDKERVAQIVKKAVKDALIEQRFRDQVEVYV